MALPRYPVSPALTAVFLALINLFQTAYAVAADKKAPAVKSASQYDTFDDHPNEPGPTPASCGCAVPHHR